MRLANSDFNMTFSYLYTLFYNFNLFLNTFFNEFEQIPQALCYTDLYLYVLYCSIRAHLVHYYIFQFLIQSCIANYKASLCYTDSY